MMELSPSLTVQLVSCTEAGVGFASWFNVKGIQVMFSGIGAFFTWLAYARLTNAGYIKFMATLVGSIFVAAYAQVMARVHKATGKICQTLCASPLVPGPNLYYMMYCIVMEEHDMAVSEALTLVVTCLGIALGFIVVEILNKYIFRPLTRAGINRSHP